jgi:flagellar biosynthesis/type III secretory pathway M-ring protein FliF/YscJ
VTVDAYEHRDPAAITDVDLYRAIFAELAEPPPAPVAEPMSVKDRFVLVVVIVVASIFVVVIVTAWVVKPSPVERARDEVTQAEQDVTELRQELATAGEAQVDEGRADSLQYELEAAEQELAEERAELAELERGE